MTDYRHQRRIDLMQQLFACTFNEANLQQCLKDHVGGTLEQILLSVTELDVAIQSVAPERPLADINKVDLAILRLIVFESKHKKTPRKVLIDEAIELAKSFGSDSSPRFINGALAKLLLESEE
jgi:transcription antitermination protein NusB